MSTDITYIAGIANAMGVSAFFRGEDTCATDSPMVDCVIEVMETNPCDYVCMAYACSPFIQAGKIRQARDLVESGEYDSVTTAYRAEPPERILIQSGDHFISRYPEYDNVNSQHFPQCYHSAGQFYYCNSLMVQLYETVMLPDFTCIEIPEAVDIDTAEDWSRAEKLWEMK